MKILVNEDTISYIGDEILGMSKWKNGVLAKDGNIFACPYSYDKVLEINIQEQTTYVYDIDSKIEMSQWSGFVESADGVLYGVPFESDLILVFDPNSKTTMTVNLDDTIDKAGTKRKWSTGVLGGNGHIYILPHDEEKVFQFKPIQLQKKYIKQSCNVYGMFVNLVLSFH